MNVLQKKKRFLISIISTFLSLVFVGYAYSPNVQHVDALSNVITYNSYGSFERVNYKSSLLQYGISIAGLVGNLQGKYSGSLSININLNGHSLSEFSVIPTNCWITYYDSTVINIQFNDVSEFEVLLTSTTLDATAIVTINSLTNWNMNMITYGDNYMQQHIYDSVNQVEGYIDNVESLLTTNNNTMSRCETLLTTIANNGTSGGSSTVNNIDVNVGQIDVNLAYVKASTDSILSSLLGFLNDSLGQIITLETLIEHIDDVTSELQALNTTLTNIDTTLTNMATTLTQINNAVSNIDNTIDTITWTSFTNPTSIEYSKDGTNYTTWNGTDYINFSTGYVYLKVNTISTRYNRLYKLTLPMIYLNTTGYDIDYVEIYNPVSDTITSYYQITSRQQIVLYYNINVSNSVNYIIIKIHVNTPTSVSQLRPSGSISLRYLENTDIEYWTLLQYMNQYEYNKKLLDAIKSISIQVTQQDITNTNNNVTNYNNTMNTIEGIENNIITNLNTDLSNLTLTSDYINPVDTNVRTAFDIVIQDFILDHNYIAGRFYLILVCSLVLLMLGRW